MKTQKGLLIAACATLLAVGAVGGVSASQSAIAKQAMHTVVRNAKLPVVNQGAALAGNAFYVNLSDVAGWWSGNNAETWVRFYNGNSEEAWVQVTQAVPNDANVYEVTVPSGYTSTNYWTKAIVCRSSGGQADDTWSNIWNQTGNMDVDSSGTNGVSVHDGNFNDASDNGKEKKQADSFKYTAETRILKWANAGVAGSWTSTGICDDDGATVKASLEDSWGDSQTEYAKIKGADVKSYFSNLVGVKGGTDVQDLAARYDHILAAHPTWDLEDFAHRG